MLMRLIQNENMEGVIGYPTLDVLAIVPWVLKKPDDPAMYGGMADFEVITRWYCRLPDGTVEWFTSEDITIGDAIDGAEYHVE